MGNFLTSWEPVASQEGMCSMELIQSLVTSHWVPYIPLPTHQLFSTKRHFFARHEVIADLCMTSQLLRLIIKCSLAHVDKFSHCPISIQSKQFTSKWQVFKQQVSFLASKITCKTYTEKTLDEADASFEASQRKSSVKPAWQMGKPAPSAQN